MQGRKSIVKVEDLYKESCREHLQKEIKKSGVSYSELADRLNLLIGHALFRTMHLMRTVDRGSFKYWFYLMCLDVLDFEEKEEVEIMSKPLEKTTKTELNTKEAAEYLGISKSTLLSWKHRKTHKKSHNIPFIRVRDRFIRYKVEDLDRFLENKKRYYSFYDQADNKEETYCSS